MKKRKCAVDVPSNSHQFEKKQNSFARNVRTCSSILQTLRSIFTLIPNLQRIHCVPSTCAVQLYIYLNSLKHPAHTNWCCTYGAAHCIILLHPSVFFRPLLYILIHSIATPSIRHSIHRVFTIQSNENEGKQQQQNGRKNYHNDFRSMQFNTAIISYSIAVAAGLIDDSWNEMYVIKHYWSSFICGCFVNAPTFCP